MPKVVGFDPSFVSQKTCQRCGAINEYNKNEAYQHRGFDFDGLQSGDWFIVCANCSGNVVVDDPN